MARTPKPPKLKYGGLNLLQRLILTFFLGAVLSLLIIPYGLAVLFDAKDITAALDREAIKAWLTVTAIAIAAFLAVTPEFWRFARANISAFSLPEPSDRRWRPITNLHKYPCANKFTSDEQIWLNSDVYNTMGVRSLWNAFQAVFVFLPLYFIGQLLSIPESAMGFVFLAAWTAIFAFLTVKDLKKFTNLRERFYQLSEGWEEIDPDTETVSPANTQRLKDSDFSFNPNAFKVPPAPKPTPKKRSAAKARTNGRHPDDAALWEVVNDAGATTEERKTALELILEREAGRKK